MLARNLTVTVLVVTAIWQLGSGVFIHAKAALAQHLLQRAWDRSLAGEQEVEPWPWADTWPVARLRAPEKNVDLIVLAGVTGRTLAFGPGHMMASVAPGETGNSVISGHRDTHFRFLEDLVPNDRFSVETAAGEPLWFQVTATEVVDIGRARLRLDAETPVLTLITCYPFDALDPGGPLRYVVTARRLTLPGADADQSLQASQRSHPSG